MTMGYIGSMHKDSLICGMATNLQGNWKRLIVTDLRNWGSVRTVSRGQAPQTDVCSAEIAIWLQFAQRRTQLSRGKRGI